MASTLSCRCGDREASVPTVYRSVPVGSPVLVGFCRKRATNPPSFPAASRSAAACSPRKLRGCIEPGSTALPARGKIGTSSKLLLNLVSPRAWPLAVGASAPFPFGFERKMDPLLGYLAKCTCSLLPLGSPGGAEIHVRMNAPRLPQGPRPEINPRWLIFLHLWARLVGRLR